MNWQPDPQQAEYDEHCRQMQEERYAEQARGVLRSIIRQIGPAECLRVIAEVVTLKPAPDEEAPF